MDNSSIEQATFIPIQDNNEVLGNISIAITDEAYINRSIKETQEDIQKREEEIFILEKKLLTLNGLKRQMDKKSVLYKSNSSSSNGTG